MHVVLIHKNAAPESAKSHLTLGLFEKCIEHVFFNKTSKNEIHDGWEVFLGRQDAVLEEANLDVPSCQLFSSTKTCFQKKSIEKWNCRTTADPRCQTEAVQERAEIHRSSTLLENFNDVLAAQLPPGSIRTPVACGLHCPRPKDCPGLGSPNTLKKCI